jgi:hypothetical protein
VYAITGTIENLDLAVILQTMNISKKTGCMEIKTGEDTSRIFFNQGSIVHALTKNLEGETAFYDLLTITSGTWGFIPDIKSNKVTISNKIEGLLLNWSNLMDEWNSIRDRLPPDDAILKIIPIPDDEREHIVFNMEEWEVFNLIKTQGLVAKIFENSTLGRFKTSKAILKFMSMDIAMLEKQDTEEIDKTISFLDDVGIELGERNLGKNHYRKIVDKFTVEIGKKYRFMNELRLDDNLKFVVSFSKGLLKEEVVSALKMLLWNIIEYVNSLVGTPLAFDQLSKVITRHFPPGDQLMIKLSLDEYMATEGRVKK